MKSIRPKNQLTHSPFQEERKQYQQLINQLTKENQMLKQQLQALTHFKHPHQDIHRAQTKEDQNMIKDLRMSQKTTKASRQTTVTCKPPIKYTIEEEVRQPQNIPSPTQSKLYEYQQKISQLANFLTQIQNKFYIQKSITKDLQDEKDFAKIVQIMQDVIKMFENDRAAFIAKIEELLRHISRYERREKEHLEKQRHLQIQLRIANEQLVIFKRLKKTK